VQAVQTLGEEMLADAKDMEADTKEEDGGGEDDKRDDGALSDMASALHTAQDELVRLRANCDDLATTLACRVQGQSDLEKAHAQLKVECTRLEGEGAKAWHDAQLYIASIKMQLEQAHQ